MKLPDRVFFTLSSHRQVQQVGRALHIMGGLPVSLGSKARRFYANDIPENRAKLEQLGIRINKRETAKFAAWNTQAKGGV